MMSGADKIENAAEKAAGKAKEASETRRTTKGSRQKARATGSKQT